MIEVTQILLNENDTKTKKIKKQTEYNKILIAIKTTFNLSNKIKDINLLIVDNDNKKFMIKSQKELNEYYNKIKKFEFYISKKELNILNELDNIINNYELNDSNLSSKNNKFFDNFKKNLDEKLLKVNTNSNKINNFNIIFISDTKIELTENIISCKFITINNIKIRNISNNIYKKLLFVKDEQNSEENINFISNTFEGTNFQNLTLESEFKHNDFGDKFSMNLTIKNGNFGKKYKIIIYIKEKINGEKLSQPLEICVKIKEKKEYIDDIYDELYKKYIINDEVKNSNIFSKENIINKIIKEELDKNKIIKWIKSELNKINNNRNIRFINNKINLIKTEKKAQYIELKDIIIQNIGLETFNRLGIFIDKEKTTNDFTFHDQYEQNKFKQDICIEYEGFKPRKEINLNLVLSIKYANPLKNYKMYLYIRECENKMNLSEPLEINVEIIDDNKKIVEDIIKNCNNEKLIELLKDEIGEIIYKGLFKDLHRNKDLVIKYYEKINKIYDDLEVEIGISNHKDDKEIYSKIIEYNFDYEKIKDYFKQNIL